MIKRISYNYLQQTYDSEDVCQTVFLKFITGNFVFKSKEHEKAWMIRTTINACHDLRKCSFFKKTVALSELKETAAPADDDPSVMEEIKKLPVHYRTAIYLHYYEGYKSEEIADIMGKRKTAIDKYLSRGRKILKENLSDCFDSTMKVGRIYGQQ